MEPMKPLFDMKFEDIPRWWPASLGDTPSALGSAHGHRYAYFAGTERLAIERGGSTVIYDTTGHDIHGVSQASGEELIVHDGAGKALNLAELKRLN